MANDQLSPAEAALLIAPRRDSGSKCLECALLALLAKGHIALEDKASLFRRKALRVSQGDGRPLPRHLEVVKHALIQHAQPVASAGEVASALRKAFGSDHARYVHDHVAPALIARGLIRRTDRKLLGLIPTIHYEHSSHGWMQAKRIAALLDELQHMKHLVRETPYRARRLLEAAGILVLLSPQARAQAKKLQEMVRSSTDGTMTPTYYGDGSSSEWQLDVDVGDLSSKADCLHLLDGISCAGDFTGGDSSDGAWDGAVGGD